MVLVHILNLIVVGFLFEHDVVRKCDVHFANPVLGSEYMLPTDECCERQLAFTFGKRQMVKMFLNTVIKTHPLDEMVNGLTAGAHKMRATLNMETFGFNQKLFE